MSSHRNAHHGTSFARRTRQTALPYTSLGCISTLVTCDTALCICSRLRGFNGTTSAHSVATRTLTIRGYVERKKRSALIFYNQGENRETRKGNHNGFLSSLTESRAGWAEMTLIRL